MNIKKETAEEHEAAKGGGLVTHDVFNDYKDKFLSADNMDIDISTVDIFSYAIVPRSAFVGT